MVSMRLPWLDPDTPFPDPETALTERDGYPGLLAAGADLSPQRLLEAYRCGIFPWFSDPQPILWWSTDPRMVLSTADFHVSLSLRKTLKKIDRSMTAGGPWEVRFDSAFATVMRECAQPRSGIGGTWISPQIIDGYADLHRLGHAHSSELWFDGKLVGGAYGVSIGRMFFGESMFARMPNASKVALAYLVHFLRSEQVAMIDCQQETSHLAALGAKAMPRRQFLARMRPALDQPPITRWVPRLLADGFFPADAANKALQGSGGPV
jgi:leucyl/phenylalanyl-tRNA--protein transferase